MTTLTNDVPQLFTEVESHMKGLREVDEAAFDLWTWLPIRSKLQRYHGDYVDEFYTTKHVIEDATSLISFLMGNSNLAVEADMEWDERVLVCICGEVHEAGEDDHHDYDEGSKMDQQRFAAKVRAINEFAKQWDDEHA